MSPYNGKPRPSQSPQEADAERPYAVSVSPQFLELSTARRNAVYRALIERGNSAVHLLDKDARMVYAGATARIMFGYDPDGLKGLDWRSLIHPDDRATFDEAWSMVVGTSGDVSGVQYRIKCYDGSWMWLEMDAVNDLATPGVDAIVSCIRNINRRKQIETDLRETESRWRFMAESLPGLMFTVSRTGEVEYANPQWEKYSGVPLKKLLSSRQAQDEIIHPDDRIAFWKAWSKAFKQGDTIVHQYRLRRKDGMYRWHICRIKPMRGHDDEHKVRLWIGSCTDIDDLQKATESRHELELQAAKLEVQKRELLAVNRSKDEFISLASHQLRTPATGVKQYLAMLLQGFAGPLNGEQMAFLQTAYDSNERQISIVNDLLQVARVDAGRVRLTVRKTNVMRLVKRVVNEHAGEIAMRSQRIVVKSVSVSVNAKVDGSRFCMVLDNILDNASKYSPPGKVITVSIAKKPAIGMVLISVTDQGAGMTAVEVGKIFNKFSRLENPLTKSVDGSGLGLYWARRIIELHGGTIKVKSRAGRGTTFYITLPV